MVTPFSPESAGTLYTNHIAMLQEGYAAALEEASFDALVVHSGLPAKQSRFDDQYWPHRLTPAFAHWLPLPSPDAVLLIQPGKRPMLFYSVVEDVWESGVEPESDHFWNAFDEIEVADLSGVASSLPRGRVGFIGEAIERAAQWNLAEESVNSGALLRALDRVRTRKSDYERACIAEANRRAALGHAAVLDAFVAGDHSELDLHLLYLRVTKQDDVHTPYKNIVAMDENAAVLHFVNYGSKPPRHKSQSLLIDAGATCMGYASDVTRTALKGKNSEAAATFAELIRGVETLQSEICRRIRPGIDYEDLHDQAHHLLAGVLRAVGIADASEGALVDSGATRFFLPHGLGHSLGIQVHDVGCRLREPKPENPYLRNTSVIESGQVFTIEPGCYFIDSLMQQLKSLPISSVIDWDLVDALTHFGGVRIEDNMAVLADETINLTRDNWPDTP
ncbi:MAG: Xaa-Pro dipeptidase [Proteobacteria bacterium]|nr:Xaa-Pro dipeptidase [Pseudomonadota bacterium]